MNETALNELRSALLTLRTDITITLPWDALHRWFGAAPLAPPHYAEIHQQWAQVWHQAGEICPPPIVYLYHGADKLTLVRETTLDDVPAVALHDLARIFSAVDD